jgi:hypothetical protein
MSNPRICELLFGSTCDSHALSSYVPASQTTTPLQLSENVCNAAWTTNGPGQICPPRIRVRMCAIVGPVWRTNLFSLLTVTSDPGVHSALAARARGPDQKIAGTAVYNCTLHTVHIRPCLHMSFSLRVHAKIDGEISPLNVRLEVVTGHMKNACLLIPVVGQDHEGGLVIKLA